MWFAANVDFAWVVSVAHKLMVEVSVCIIAFTVGDFLFGRYLFAKSRRRTVSRKVSGSTARPAAARSPTAPLADQSRVKGFPRAAAPAKTVHEFHVNQNRCEPELAAHAITEDQRLKEISVAFDFGNFDSAVELVTQYVAASTSAAKNEDLSFKLVQLACKSDSVEAVLVLLEAERIPLVPAMLEAVLASRALIKNHDLVRRVMRLRARLKQPVDCRVYSRLVLSLVEQEEAAGGRAADEGAAAPETGPVHPKAEGAPPEPQTHCAAGVRDGHFLRMTEEAAAEATQALDALFGPLFNTITSSALEDASLPDEVAALLDKAPLLKEAVKKVRNEVAWQGVPAPFASIARPCEAAAAAEPLKPAMKTTAKTSREIFSATPGQPCDSPLFPAALDPVACFRARGPEQDTTQRLRGARVPLDMVRPRATKPSKPLPPARLVDGPQVSTVRNPAFRQDKASTHRQSGWGYNPQQCSLRRCGA